MRGLQQMIEADRYCPDELQQINAVIAALREVALLITTDYLRAAVAEATKPGGTAADAAVAEMVGVLARADPSAGARGGLCCGL